MAVDPGVVVGVVPECGSATGVDVLDVPVGVVVLVSVVDDEGEAGSCEGEAARTVVDVIGA